jgi:hypothetical protein
MERYAAPISPERSDLLLRAGKRINAREPASQGKKRQGEARPVERPNPSIRPPDLPLAPPQIAGIIGDMSRVQQAPEVYYPARPVLFITK